MAQSSSAQRGLSPFALREVVVGLVRMHGADLSARQLAILLTTSLEPGPHTVRGLAESLKISKPAITRSLDRLAEFGLVRRMPDPEDRRSVLVGRTRIGSAYLANLRGLVTEAIKVERPVGEPKLIRRSA